MPRLPRLPRLRLPALALLAASLVPALASAQWIRPGEETFTFNVGAVSQKFDSSARVDGSAILGTSFNLERDAGLPGDKTTYVLQGSWRVAPHHRIEALYTESTRSASRSLDRTLVIGNVTLPVSAVLSAEQKTAVGYLGYRYSLVKSQGMEIAAGLGAYGGNLQARFKAINPSLNVDQSTTVPLPVVGLSVDSYLSERLTLNGTVRGLKLKVNGIEGEVLSVGAAAEYLFTKNLGVGLSFERFDVTVSGRKSKLDGQLELGSTAGRLYLTSRF